MRSRLAKNRGYDRSTMGVLVEGVYYLTVCGVKGGEYFSVKSRLIDLSDLHRNISIKIY